MLDAGEGVQAAGNDFYDKDPTKSGCSRAADDWLAGIYDAITPANVSPSGVWIGNTANLCRR